MDAHARNLLGRAIDPTDTLGGEEGPRVIRDDDALPHFHYHDEVQAAWRSQGGSGLTVMHHDRHDGGGGDDNDDEPTDETQRPPFATLRRASQVLPHRVKRMGEELDRAQGTAFDTLPTDMLPLIFAFVSTHDLRACTETCRRFFLSGRGVIDKRLRDLPSHHRSFLSQEQQEVYDAVTVKRRSVFVGGRAGCGKSHLMRAIVGRFDELGVTAHVAAFTGAAAQNLGGTTIHDFMGLGASFKTPSELRHLAKPAPPAIANHAGVTRARLVEALVLDEVSMISPDLFQYLDLVMRTFRHRPDDPFGGVQIICTGDFMQLEPIVNRDDALPAAMSNNKPWSKRAVANASIGPSTAGMTFCFETALWRRLLGDPYDPANKRTFYLTVPMRQRTDTVFCSLLDRVRSRAITNGDVALLQSRREEVVLREEEGARDRPPSVKIVPFRAEAARANRAGLDSLLGAPECTFRAEDRRVYYGESPEATRFFESCLVPRELSLRQGARVMLLRNHAAHGLFNGSLGTVRKLFWLQHSADTEELEALLDGRHVGDLVRQQCDVFNVLSDGHAELCHSAGYWRVHHVPGAFHDPAIPLRRTRKVPGLCCGTAEGLGDPEMALPVIEFDRKPGCFYLVLPDRIEAYARHHVGGGLIVSRLVAWRFQLPLDLAFASTTHKIQGATLERAAVSLRGCRRASEIYVALSRVRRLQDLTVLGALPLELLNPAMMNANLRRLDRVLEKKAADKRARRAAATALVVPLKRIEPAAAAASAANKRALALVAVPLGPQASALMPMLKRQRTVVSVEEID